MNIALRPSPERLQSGLKYVLEMPARLRLFAGITEGLAGVALVFAPLIHDGRITVILVREPVGV
jgi:hypothetical protein